MRPTRLLVFYSMLAATLVGVPAHATGFFSCATSYFQIPEPTVSSGYIPGSRITKVCTRALQGPHVELGLKWSVEAVARADVVMTRNGSSVLALSCYTSALGGCVTESSVPGTFYVSQFGALNDMPQVWLTAELPGPVTLTFTLQPTFPATCLTTVCIAAATGLGGFNLFGLG